MKIIYGKYYVYRHYIIEDNGEENTFYIGKGISGRFATTERNKHWEDIVKANNNEFHAEILEYFDDENEAYAKEKELQDKYWKLGQCLGCADLYQKNMSKENVNFIHKLKTDIDFKKDFVKFLNELNIKEVMFTLKEIEENFTSFSISVARRKCFSNFIDSKKLKEKIIKEFLKEYHFVTTWSIDNAIKNSGISKKELEQKAKNIYKEM